VLDVIVVGAGPAGSSCARRAAELGLTTLVLEKASFPRPKPCASGLSARALEALGDAVTPVLHDTVDTIRVVFGPGLTLRWQGRDRVLATTTRRELDARLVGLAESAGARFEFGRRVSAVTPEGEAVSVTAGAERWTARFAVAADGPWSAVRRALGLARPRHGGAIYVRAYPGDADLLARFRGAITFDLSAARRGYGWIFPKRDHVNVGVYRQAPLSRDLRGALSSFLEAVGLGSWTAEGPYAFPIPIDARVAGLGSGRVLLAGDAAGLTDPITGEGIPHAIASGRLAAEAVAAAAESGGLPDARYRSRVLSEVLPRVNVVRRAGNVCYSLGPRTLSLAARNPAFRSALMRLGPWGRLGPEGGRLDVESS
jgi:geranylgeranyl reductase family protein